MYSCFAREGCATSAAVKYTITYEGREITLREYQDITGVPAHLIRWRIQHNRPLFRQSDARYRQDLEARNLLEKQGWANGYTYGEIAGLYRNFAGQENELEMLRDFTGLGTAAAQTLLEKLKRNRKGK